MIRLKSIVQTTICLLFISPGLSAQTGTFADSLYHIYRNAKDDSTKAAVAVRLAAAFQISHPDTAIYYATEAERLFQELNDVEGIFDAVAEKCYAYAYARNDIEALRQLARLEKISKQIKNQLTDNWFIYISGDIYQDLDEYGKALDYYKRVLNNYTQLAQNDKNYVGRVANVNIMIGEVYNKMGNPDSSLYYLYQGKGVYDSLKREWEVIPILIGGDHWKKGNIDSAFYYFRSGLNLALSKGAGPLNLQKAYLGLANCFYSINNYDSCKIYASLALTANAKGSFPDWTLIIHQLLGKVYQSKNQPDSALFHLKKAIIIKDSLYDAGKIRLIQRLDFEKQIQQQQQEQKAKTYKTYLWISILAGSLFTVLIVVFIQFRNQKQKQKAYALLQKQKEETEIQKSKAEKSLQELKSTQAQLIHREKMASLGELTAGIAHEIQNPLNFVNNFSDVNAELVEELKSELLADNKEEAISIANHIKENEQKINHHGKRADAIVKGMLQHSRANSGKKELTNMNALAEEYLRLSYHGLRAKDKDFNAAIETDFDESIGKIEVVPQDIGRVLLNLYNNAFYAASLPAKGASNKTPTVWVSTKKEDDRMVITVKDNGPGIPAKIVDKIFQPFFTTKPTGQATGLGLSLSYDIVKAHGGELKVETKEGEGAEFIILLPNT